MQARRTKQLTVDVIHWQKLHLFHFLSFLRNMSATSHTSLFFLNNCFPSLPPGCPGARRGSLARRQAARPGPGTCRVLPCLWTAGWLWTVAAGGGNQSPLPSISASPSTSLSMPVFPSLQPPAACIATAVGPFMFTCRRQGEARRNLRGRRAPRGAGGGQCKSSSNGVRWFRRIKRMKAEKTKAGACSHDHPILDWSE